MVNINDALESQISQSLYLLRNEALSRGWSVYVPYIGSSILEFVKPEGARIRTLSTTPPTSSYAAGYLVNDKFATHSILTDVGLPVLPTVLIDITKQPLNYEEILVSLGSRSVVVKPIDGGHGKGITIGIQTAENLQIAIDVALQETRSINKVIVQTMYENPKDLRLLCINHIFVAALLRIPARVIGDGVHDIATLIELENKNQDRGEAYKARLTYIDVKKARQHLGEAIYSIPKYDEVVEVIGVANFGQGGETQDCTDDIPAWLVQYAENASKASELFVCGVDFLVSATPSKDAAEETLRPMITEVNKCPSFYVHERPTHGDSRPVSKHFIDYIDTLF